MLRLKKLTLKNFRSFKEATTIEFPESGLVCLRGLNKDSGVSSGSGKSSILLAISYALGYCPFDGTVLKSWGSKTGPNVSLTLSLGEKTIEINRSPNLDVSVNGVSIGGSAAHKEAELVKLLGVPLSVLGALTYRAQGEPSYFLSMTDSKKKEFLSEILGLDKFEEVADDAIKEANEKAGEVGRLTATLEALKSARPPEPVLSSVDITPLIEAIENAERQAAEFKKELEANKLSEQAFMDSAKAEYEKREAELKPLRDELQAQINQIRQKPNLDIEDNTQKYKDRLSLVRTKINDAKSAYEAKINDKQIEVREIGLELRRLEKLVEKGQDAEADKKLLLKRQAAIKEQMQCPTCYQPWIGGGADRELDKLTKEIRVLEQDIKEGEKAQELLNGGLSKKQTLVNEELSLLISKSAVPTMLEDAERELVAKLASETQAINSKKLEDKLQREKTLAALEKQKNEVILKLAEIESEIAGKYAKDLELLRQFSKKAEIALSELGIPGLKASLATARIQNVQSKERYSQELDRYNRIADSISQAQYNKDTKEKECLALKDFVALIGREGFLGAIFDEILAEISIEINKRLATFPNVQHINFRWQSERETASGTVRKEIRPALMANGLDIPISAVSGGQNSSIQQAVDRAVREVVARRSGLNPGWLVMDEAFEGMDGTVKENCLELLKEMASDTLVLVVDHSKEFLELFDRKLEVVCDGGNSTVQWYK